MRGKEEIGERGEEGVNPLSSFLSLISILPLFHLFPVWELSLISPPYIFVFTNLDQIQFFAFQGLMLLPCLLPSIHFPPLVLLVICVSPVQCKSFIFNFILSFPCFITVTYFSHIPSFSLCDPVFVFLVLFLSLSSDVPLFLRPPVLLLCL